MKVKICGLNNHENLQAIQVFNPDLLGFIFYEKSPRYLDLNRMEKPIQELETSAKKVGVFVDAPIDQVLAYSQLLGLDYCQLHGDESLDYVQTIKAAGLKIIKVFRIGKAGIQKQHLDAFDGLCEYFLFDTNTKNYGGSGKKFDWAIINKYKGKTPFILSGGIGPEDAALIAQVDHPMFAGVDLNSRFESEPGIKNTDSLNQFFTALKNQKSYDLFNR